MSVSRLPRCLFTGSRPRGAVDSCDHPGLRACGCSCARQVRPFLRLLSRGRGFGYFGCRVVVRVCRWVCMLVRFVCVLRATACALVCPACVPAPPGVFLPSFYRYPVPLGLWPHNMLGARTLPGCLAASYALGHPRPTK